MHVNWVAISSVATALALVLSALAFRTQAMERRRGRPRRVSVTVSGAHGSATAYEQIDVAVHNHSGEPIYNVFAFTEDPYRLSVDDGFSATVPPTTSEPAYVSLHDVPRTGPELPTIGGPALPRVGVHFMDAAGRHWTRRANGELVDRTFTVRLSRRLSRYRDAHTDTRRGRLADKAVARVLARGVRRHWRPR